MTWHRRLDRRPELGNVEKYGQAWIGWHEELRAKAGYEDMVKGGGNGIFLLILSLRWWADSTDTLEEGLAKDLSKRKLKVAIGELEETLARVLGSRALHQAIEGPEKRAEDMETRHGKR